MGCDFLQFGELSFLGLYGRVLGRARIGEETEGQRVWGVVGSKGHAPPKTHTLKGVRGLPFEGKTLGVTALQQAKPGSLCACTRGTL